MRTSSTAPLALTAALALAGCSSPEPTRPRTTTAGEAPTALSHPGPAEYGVVSRELAALENAPIDNVYQATQEALRDLELRLVDKTKDRLSATVGARTAHDDRVTIAMSRVTSGVTDVKIKVGFWGDEAQSRAILTEIRRKLSTPATGSKGVDPALLNEPAVLAAAPKPASAKKPPATPASPTSSKSPASPAAPAAKTPVKPPASDQPRQ